MCDSVYVSNLVLHSDATCSTVSYILSLMMFQAIEGSDMLWLASVDSLHRFLTEDPITEAEREAQEGTPLAFIRKWKALSALNPDLFDDFHLVSPEFH